MKQSLLMAIGFLMILKPVPASSGPSRTGEEKCPRRVMVLVERVQPRSFTQFCRYEATFFPESVAVRSPDAGMVTDIKVSDGDRVSSGYVLVMLNEGVGEELEMVEAELTHWKETLRKRERWRERNPGAEAEAKERIAEFEAQRNVLKNRKTGVGVPAPLGGVVELMVTPGTEVVHGDEVARVVNGRRKLATFRVDADDKDLFLPGMEIPLADGLTARVSDRNERRVWLVAEDIADSLKSDPVRFQVLKREVRNRVVLPAEQILWDESGHHVFLATGETASRANLEMGAEYGGRVWVTSGIQVGDLLITARILSEKQGGVDPSLSCLSQGKRIVVMEKNPETGLFEKSSGETTGEDQKFPEKDSDISEESESIQRDNRVAG